MYHKVPTRVMDMNISVILNYLAKCEKFPGLTIVSYILVLLQVWWVEIFT